MAGKFELKKGLTGKYHFNLKAGNGEVIATSENYNSKSGALNGIESVKRSAPDATTDDQTRGVAAGPPATGPAPPFVLPLDRSRTVTGMGVPVRRY
jgi:hypothetical protein